MTKLFLVATASDFVLKCQTSMGPYGYSEEFGLECYAPDVLVLPIFSGSSAVQRNNIASLMQLPRK